MRIIKIKINSYKSINNLHLDNLFDTNIFIGPNNSGKSNILDAVESVFLPCNDENYFVDAQSDYSIEVKLDKEIRDFFDTNFDIMTIQRKGAEKKYFLGDLEITNNKNLCDFFTKRTVRFNSNLVDNVNRIREDYADLKANYHQSFERLWQIFHKIFPDINDIISSEISNATNQEIKAKLKDGDKIVEFSRLGTGIRRVFVMMLYIFHPRYTIILMNEPEIHLHPALIKKIHTILSTKTLSQQVFITTHSPIFITPENLEQVFRVSKNRNQQTDVYNFTKQDNINKKRLVQEFNADNLEMFFADKVVIVEGVSDRILIRGLIDKFYTGFKDIKVISVAGKSNIGIYMKVMNIFKIPYLVMLDRDALSGSQIEALTVHLPKKTHSRSYQIEYLKNNNIYVLSNGTIEKNYPRRYQKRDTKPLNALFALSNITRQDFDSSVMKNLKEIIEVL